MMDTKKILDSIRINIDNLEMFNLEKPEYVTLNKDDVILNKETCRTLINQGREN